MPKPNYGSGANYSTLSSELLCKSCKHGQVLESHNGHSQIFCTWGSSPYGAIQKPITILVTRCNRQEKEDVGKIWNNAIEMDVQDGSLWMTDGRWFQGIGHVHPRIDTFHSRKWIVKQFPTKVLDLDTEWWEGEVKPVFKDDND